MTNRRHDLKTPQKTSPQRGRRMWLWFLVVVVVAAAGVLAAVLF